MTLLLTESKKGEGYIITTKVVPTGLGTGDVQFQASERCCSRIPENEVSRSGKSRDTIDRTQLTHFRLRLKTNGEVHVPLPILAGDEINNTHALGSEPKVGCVVCKDNLIRVATGVADA